MIGPTGIHELIDQHDFSIQAQLSMLKTRRSR